MCFSLADLRQKCNGETLGIVGLCEYSFTIHLRNRLSGAVALEGLRSDDLGESQEAI